MERPRTVENTDERPRTRCKSDRVRSNRSGGRFLASYYKRSEVDRSHKPFSPDRLSIPIFPRGIGYLLASIFLGPTRPSFLCPPPPPRMFSVSFLGVFETTTPPTKRTTFKRLGWAFFFSSLTTCAWTALSVLPAMAEVIWN